MDYCYFLVFTSTKISDFANNNILVPVFNILLLLSSLTLVISCFHRESSSESILMPQDLFLVPTLNLVSL